MTTPVDRLLSGDPEIGRTDALVVVQAGEVVLERYGEGVGPDTTLRSWSMAKSMLHAAVGILVDEGALALDARAPVDLWAEPADARHAITLRHLMTMRSGLRWVEDPAPGQRSDVVDMVYGNRRGPQIDTARWAADRPLARPPGAAFQYASANSAIVSAVVRDLVGPGDAYARWLRERLFDPVGMASAKPRFDPSGSWMASSFCFCTARDFARFGQLYLDRGRVGGVQLLSERWVDTASAETGRDDTGHVHTMHWWRFGDDPWDAFHGSGYLGQFIIVVPSLDLVAVRLGETTPAARDHLTEALRDLLASYDR